ncbi:glycosyltransferase family A protein [Bacteroides sp. 519]|uniref:glycosyltransferase family 2 protein n=1 Tax=Bacteroides sp. 519 TaxID=2302937 RepID=UPI0013D26AA1|nr:glycosyltransferase family A protein [Bacteroides sp. 519]NDV57391.1 glycosyltransferase family 2 protein [Bacteroides sp. 519]
MFETVLINTIIGSAQLKEAVCTLQMPYTALCLRNIDIIKNMSAINKALRKLSEPSVAFCFFGPYFLGGSVRDDFDFGPVLLFKTSVLQKIAAELQPSKYAAFYELWLKASYKHIVYSIPITLEEDATITANSQFDYVDPRNREVQIEMEMIFSSYLKKTNALLTDTPAPVTFLSDFPVEASVIIPVKNRKETIADALQSALNQKTNNPYNVIVVDNHSTDGTTEIISRIASGDNRLIHIIPETKDLQIGGCWNLAANHSECGKFCIQLDSDDVYSSPNTIQKILDTFYTEKCGMLVGSYTLTDFHLNTIPPGLIDHREWTKENGRNNLLRINGIGAPRSFYTPLLRKHPAPNVSYGEDYALALVFSRLYPIGRIYESLYYCRRWRDNSDAAPGSAEKVKQNFFKDELRTFEILDRTSHNISLL